MLQLIMNIANSNNNRKNENNNNNNDNNNNNINEGITLLLNEYTNEVMATGNGVGREIFTDDDFEVNELEKEYFIMQLLASQSDAHTIAPHRDPTQPNPTRSHL